MTMTAFILLSVEIDNRRNVLQAVNELDEVVEAYIIFGSFDIIIKAEFKDHEGISGFVVDQLRAIEGVIDTQTNLCATCD
ncbi:MAG: Lrp/AsnC family transcriptional regulator [Candidatus Thorarchaeota archaeon]